MGSVRFLAGGGLDYSQTGTLVNAGQPTLDVIPSFIDGDGMQIGAHPFGQDQIGRDYFALTMRGAQKSLIICFTIGILATIIGTTLGAISGYYGGKTGSTIMRLTDLLLTIPILIIAAVVGQSAFGQKGVFFLAIVLSLLIWTSLARLVRGEFLSLREKEFVEAARAMGASSPRIIFRHMLPNAMGTIIVSATLTIASAILLEAALSFLGLRSAISRYLAWTAHLHVSERLHHATLVVLVARPVHHGHRTVDQLHRRRSARRPRPKADQGACMSDELLLEVNDLAVTFPTEDGLVTAVRGVSYTLHEREVLAIVGESGSGKSVAAMALMRLLPPTARITGSVRFRGKEILDLPPKEARSLRGRNIAMIFQDPMTAMNPVYTVGDQLAEAYRSHHRVARNVALGKAVEMLDKVGIPRAKDRARAPTPMSSPAVCVSGR